MSASDSTSAHRPAVGGLTLDERLDRIEGKIDTMMETEHDVNTAIARVQDKLELHDKILMGVCGTVGISILAALLKLVVFVKD